MGARAELSYRAHMRTWYLGLALAFLGCGGAPPQIARVERTSEPPVETDRAPAVPVCNGIASCRSECERGDELGCRRMNGFSPARYDERIELIGGALERACAGAVPRMCLHVAWFECDQLETDAQSCNDRRMELLQRACDAGEGAACEDMAEFGEGAPEHHAAWREQGRSLMHAQCELGDYLACSFADVPIDEDTELTRTFRTRITRACEHENDALACLIWGWHLGVEDPEGPRWRERGCEIADDDVDCD
jgi:hypothetical protein